MTPHPFQSDASLTCSWTEKWTSSAETTTVMQTCGQMANAPIHGGPKLHMPTVIRPLTTAECGDLAITAAEGGIGYWSVIERYQPSRWVDLDTGECQTVESDFVFYTINEAEPTGSWHDLNVTPELIQRGWHQAINHPGWRQAVDLDEPSETDAAGADLVIQLGAFGEETYS